MAHPVDIHVGRRIRQQRWLVGMTQAQLAEAVGIKFQQIQKYETGANRVAASRLWEIAGALSVPVARFFEGMDEAEAVPDARDLLADKAALELLRAYRATPAALRPRLLAAARGLAEAAA